jgi:hypothetical protein
VAYESRHPPPQLDFDPELQTLVVLGNGWAATSFLKSLDTSGWNVVRRFESRPDLVLALLGRHLAKELLYVRSAGRSMTGDADCVVRFTPLLVRRVTDPG